MAIPIVAGAAALAYLNARWRFPLDRDLMGNMVKTLFYLNRRQKRDRLSAFYIIEENAQNKALADKPFLLYEDKSWTFKQFYDRVLHYAGWLHSVHKVTRGEVVAIDFMNSPEILILTVAVWSIGALPALINYNLSGETLAHSLRTSSARLMIVEAEVATNVLDPETKANLSSPTFRNNALPLEVVTLDPELQASVEHFKPYRAPDSARSGAEPRNPAVLMSTSGTTGMPKQAVVGLARFIGGGLIASCHCGIRSATSRKPDIFYTAMPIYHGTAFIAAFGLAMTSQTTLAIGRRFSASSFWPEVKQHNATAIQYVGEVLRYLIAAPERGAEDRNHKVRLAFGNGLRPDVWKKFRARFGIETIVELYAATEGTFGIFNINRNDFSDGAVAQQGTIYNFIMSLSLPLVKVDWETEEPWRDPATGFCVKVPRGEPGEILAKLDSGDPHERFPGYYNNEKATQSKVLRNVFVKGDAYFRSGDVLRWDSEGRIWFLDRIGDTFRWKSENISTMEVGEVLGYHPDVLEANVYGVSVPGYEGRAGCAALLLKDTALEDGQGGTNVKPDVLRSLASYSRNSLQKGSIPIFLRAVRSMVTTGNNKSIKHILRSQGIDLQAIKEAGSGDQLYWLEPGAERYVKFDPEHQAALTSGKVRL